MEVYIRGAHLHNTGHEWNAAGLNLVPTTGRDRLLSHTLQVAV